MLHARDALLHCPDWEGVGVFGVHLRMCSVLGDFVASEHMINVLLLRQPLSASCYVPPFVGKPRGDVMSVSWWHMALFCCKLFSTDIAGSSLAPSVASRQRAQCSAWSCRVLCLSLGAGVVVSRRNVPSLPPMLEIRDRSVCEKAQFFCPCTAATADSTEAPAETHKFFLIQHQAFQRLTRTACAQT